MKPAFEQADLGRAIEIAHGAVTVGGVRRRVDWEGEVPGDLAGTIHTVTSECRGDVIVRRADDTYSCFCNPSAAPTDAAEADIAFAEVMGPTCRDGISRNLGVISCNLAR